MQQYLLTGGSILAAPSTGGGSLLATPPSATMASGGLGTATLGLGCMTGILLNAATGGEGPKSSAPGSQRNPDVPDKAYDVLETVKKQNGAPPKNHKSHKFQNKDAKLPEGDYKMYDVNPKPSNGMKRDSERIVIDSKTGKAHYTKDHYNSFTPMN